MASRRCLQTDELESPERKLVTKKFISKTSSRYTMLIIAKIFY